MLEPTKIGIEYVTRNESGSDPAGDGLQFALTDQCANVVLGAAELGGNLAHCQGCGPLHVRSMACGSSTSGLLPVPGRAEQPHGARFANGLMAGVKDRWAEWLAERRFGGDAEVRRRLLVELSARRDKVLDLARLAEGETLLDVGCGEGLIGFGALGRGASSVIFSDVSEDLLDLCARAATDLGVVERCRFIQAPADDLSVIGDGSVDVVTTRSVLIYVADKRAAFGEFARVLRSGGRISLFEPINRFAIRPDDTWFGYDLSPLGDLGQKLRAIFETIQPPDSDPMLDFDERDLFRLAEETGFFPIELHLEAESRPTEPRSWHSFLNSAGNPNIPTLAEAMGEAFTPDERDRFSDYLRPLVEQGRGEWRMALAHLAAVKAN